MKKIIKVELIIFLIIIGISMFLGDVKAEYKNNNPLLIDLLIDGKEINPPFDQFITDYVMATEKEEIEIEAVPDDPNAVVEIIGNTKLNAGKNDIEIKVTAEDQKTTQSYYLHITKGNINQANANLKKIEVEGFDLNPKFNEKDTNYLVEYEGDIDKFNITAIPESEKAKVEILDNDNFSSTIHIITIRVTAEDGITTKEYKLTAKKKGKDVEDPSGIIEEVQNKEDDKKQSETNFMNTNTVIIIVVIILVGIIALSLFLKRRK